MLTSSLIVKVPVAPHVKDFLIGEYGAEPIAIHQNTFLGSVISLVAEKCPYRMDAPKLNVSEFTTVKIKLPKALKHKTITPESLRGLGNFFDKHFRQQFIMYMKGQIEITGNENHAITTFYKRFNINPDHFDMETLRKVWRDYKEKVYRDNEKTATRSRSAA